MAAVPITWISITLAIPTRTNKDMLTRYFDQNVPSGVTAADCRRELSKLVEVCAEEIIANREAGICTTAKMPMNLMKLRRYSLIAWSRI